MAAVSRGSMSARSIMSGDMVGQARDGSQSDGVAVFSS